MVIQRGECDDNGRAGASGSDGPRVPGREHLMSAGLGKTRRGRARAGESPAAQVRRVVEEACNNGDLAVLDDVVAPPIDGTAAPSWARLRDLLAAFRAAVPDAHWTIVEQIVGRDKVVTRLVVQGTFSGPLLGLAPPGRPATLTGVAISQFAEQRLVALWLQADLLGLLVQLGVLPPLDIARAVAMAEVARAGAMLAAEPAPRAPPEAPRHGVPPDARAAHMRFEGRQGQPRGDGVS